MKGETNIAEILRGCPKGTKLYSATFGEARLLTIDDDGKYPIVTIQDDHRPRNFTAQGCIDDNPKAVCTLFPSDEMRDWDKFFKRGDILTDKVFGGEVIFDHWAKDDYTVFYTTSGTHYETAIYRRSDLDERARFIAKLESTLKGTFNPVTLEVEAKKKWEFVPFQKVVVRDEKHDNWKAGLFSHVATSGNWPYECVGSAYKECIPYNDETKQLIGTNRSYNKTESND